MTDQRPARRHPASAFPEIRGVRLKPPDAAATLVNLSATGVLVECATRILPGRQVTLRFEGSFDPAIVSSRVVRCEVAGISADGALHYHLGLVFSEPIPLAQDADDALADEPFPPVPGAVVTAQAEAPAVLRNRW